MTDLAKEYCENQTSLLAEDEVAELARQVPEWKCEKNSRLQREYSFQDFMAAFNFVALIVPLAESENHHPDIELGWGRAMVTLTTHSVSGLSRNDFIMAAKIDRLT
jgi:4a-hydroxytetrahydrobiopterin dehydratase